MINKILQDLINIGEVASFIDNVIVEIEEEKKYDGIVEKVVKRLAENNLYVKPEKYKWKVREVGFLEVVIGPERIKMKEEKVKRVLLLLFFLNQQFIIWSTRVAHGSYFVTTYKRGRYTWRKRKERQE